MGKKQTADWLQHVGPSVSNSFAIELQLLVAHVAEIGANATLKFKETKLGAIVDDWQRPEAPLRIARALIAAIAGCQRCEDHKTSTILCEALAILLRRNLALDVEELTGLIGLVGPKVSMENLFVLLPNLLSTAKRILGAGSLGGAEITQLSGLRHRLAQGPPPQAKAAAKHIATIDRLCNDSVARRLLPDEGWASHFSEWLGSLPDPKRAQWEAICRDAAAIEPEPPARDWKVTEAEIGYSLGTESERYFAELRRLQLARRPSDAWRRSMTDQVAAIGQEPVGELLRRLLHKVPASKPGGMVRESLNRELLRGLLWLGAEIGDREIAQAVAAVARPLEAMNSPLADTALCVLHLMGSRVSGAALVTLSSKLKGSSRRDLALAGAESIAERLGISIDEFEQDATPDFGFTGFGTLAKRFGEVQAELRIPPHGAPAVHWSRGEKELKSVPASIRRDHPLEIEALKADAKGVRETLASLATRLEASWLAQSIMPFEAWQRERIDHPVAGTVGRRLIWRFRTEEVDAAVCWSPHGFVGADGSVVDVPGGAKVDLWHPLNAVPEQVFAWRERLEAGIITQPFKQAHREVYVLTAAERATGAYSNRFAAHVIRQAQFRQLAKSRGWSSGLMGPWDSGDHMAAERKLPNWGLRAEFWLNGGSEELQTGYAYVFTDQVRFKQLVRSADDDPIPLEDVPPLVFSEIMRDVDLFVGVCSVGNDPTWADGGPAGRHIDYWQSYSFGDLGESAKTRKAVLEKLIPRLKIASRCRFVDKFLVVKGDLRTYRIHLGSGNILMDPNDQYLCIVPKAGQGGGVGNVFLPFEGDARLSVILSKALLLADDRKITDPTIVSQIKPA